MRPRMYDESRQIDEQLPACSGEKLIGKVDSTGRGYRSNERLSFLFAFAKKNLTHRSIDSFSAHETIRIYIHA